MVSAPSPAGARARVGHQLDAFDDLAAAHLEDLDDRAGRPDLEAERVAIAERRATSSSAGAGAACRSCESRRAAARPARSAPRRPPRTSAAAGPRRARRCALRGTAACAAPPPRSASGPQISRTQGAMQRPMSYSRHGRARSPVITSLHDRMPNSRCVSVIVLRAERGGQERARVDSGRPARRAARPARAGTPRPS